MLVLPITKDFDKLLEDRGLASIATLRKFGRVVVVTVDTAFVLVVAV